MGHALKEIWRVLRAEGILIDLRPQVGNPPLEIIAGGRELLLAGSVDASLDAPDFTAATEVLIQAVHKGWFVCERDESFDYALYWDTLDQMEAYIKEIWTRVCVPETVLAEARRLMANGGEDARLCVRRNIIISRYRKHFQRAESRG